MTNAQTGKNEPRKNNATIAPCPCAAAMPANTANAMSRSAVTMLIPVTVSPADGTQSATAQALASTAAQTTPMARPAQLIALFISDLARRNDDRGGEQREADA